MRGFDGGRSSFGDGEGFKQLLLIVEQLQIRFACAVKVQNFLKCHRRLLSYKSCLLEENRRNFLFEMNYANTAGEALRLRAINRAPKRHRTTVDE